MRSRFLGGQYGPLVGRDRELARIVAAAEAATAGRGEALLVLGDAGMGKTRLLQELDRLADDGVTVAWGRGWRPEDAPSFWPWMQVFRSLAAHRGRDELASSGHVASILGRVVPDLVGHLGQEPLSTLPTPMEVLDALASCLLRSAAAGPVLILLDDLHDADDASLDLLNLLAMQTGTAPLSIVAASRPTVASSGLSEIAARSDVLVLHGLDTTAVTLLAEAAGAPLSDAQAEQLHRATGGNPFLVLESVTDEDNGGSGGLPAGVRGLVASRLTALEPQMVDVLLATAVLDELADEDVLAAVLERDVIEVAEDLKALADLNLVERIEERVGGWAVPHDLVREAVLAHGQEGHRRELQAAAARVLSSRYGTDATRAAAIAHHAVAAIPHLSSSEAVRHLRRAADHATSRFSHAEAARHLSFAASLLRADPDSRPALLAVLLHQGDAQARGSEPASAHETYEEATELARRLVDPAGLARAVLGICDSLRRAPRLNMEAEDVIPLIDEALALLDTADPNDGHATLRTQLLSTRALHGAISGQTEGVTEDVEHAARVAEASGGARPLAQVAASRRLSLSPAVPPERRRAVTRDLVDLAARSGDLELEYRATEFTLTDALEAGDPVAAAAAVDECTALAGRMHEPYFETLALVWQGTLALLQGRFTDLEAITERAVRATQTAQGAGGELLGGQQIYAARELGTLDPAGLDALVEQFPEQPVIRALRMWGHAHAGSRERARELLEEMTAAGLDHLPRNTYWLVTIAMLAEVAARVRASDSAATVLRLLTPLPDQCVVTTGGPMAWTGPMRYYTGLLRLVTGDRRTAARDLSAALATAQRMGARPTIARVRIGLAAAISGVDRTAAASHLRTARELAASMGMRWLVSDVDALAEEIGLDVEAAPGGGGAPAHRRAILRARGAGWEVGFEGAVGTVRDTKGMRHLYELVSHPNAEVHVLDLVTALQADRPAGDTAGLPVRRGGHAGVVLDNEALRAYRTRLAELETELDAADAAGDVERASRAGRERDALLEELSSGVGLGGRPRRTADDVERARLNVTRAIRTAIDRIRAVDAVLADHLDTAVHTGRECSYTPDPTSAVAWRLTS